MVHLRDQLVTTFTFFVSAAAPLAVKVAGAARDAIPDVAMDAYLASFEAGGGRSELDVLLPFLELPLDLIFGQPVFFLQLTDELLTVSGDDL
jgi:hypothetical protein